MILDGVCDLLGHLSIGVKVANPRSELRRRVVGYEPMPSRKDPHATARPAAATAGALKEVCRSPSGGRRRRSGLQITKFSCQPVDDLEPHALGVTYWFDPPAEDGPILVRVRLHGRRIGVKGKPGRRDVFEKVETIEEVPARSGPVAVTSRVSDLAPGEWHVTVTAEAQPSGNRPSAGSPLRLASGSTSGHTVYAPVVRVSAPGARIGVWPALVGVGVVCALVVQFLIGRRYELPSVRVLVASLVASLVGLVGAKVYYLVEHRRRRPPLLTAGMCIQGFVLAATAALIAGAALTGVSVGRLLDVTTPGLLLGMAIGRVGCFFGGCCAGRPTGSRFGLWSSDRRLGLRRIPTQLMESAVALGVGLGTTAAVAIKVASPAGMVFAAGMAAYTLGRQLLFPLRDLPRNTAAGRTLTTVSAAGVLVVSVAMIALS